MAESHSDSDSNPKTQPETVQTEEERLKYLEFVQAAWLNAVLGVTRAYGYAKENSGPLKTRVETIEGTVKNVVGPVYDKFNGVPVDVLKFVDRKVHESVTKLDGRVPPIVKKVSNQALSAAQKAPVAARAVATEVKSAGVMGSASGLAKTAYTKYEPAAKELYSKYEPVAGQYAASAWRTLNQLPLFPHVAKVVLPTAAYYTEKYNQKVQQTADKGYKVSSYLPLVPTEKIAKVFSGGEVQAA